MLNRNAHIRHSACHHRTLFANRDVLTLRANGISTAADAFGHPR
jgi:hypothetical protein